MNTPDSVDYEWMRKLNKTHRVIRVTWTGKYLIQSLLCIIAIFIPWYELSQSGTSFTVGVNDFVGFPIIGFILIFILSVYALQRILRKTDYEFTKKIEIFSLIGMSLTLLETIAYPRFRPGVGGRDESFGITYLLKFNAMGYTISPLFGYLATAIIIILVFSGLALVFLQIYIIREFLYYPKE